MGSEKEVLEPPMAGAAWGMSGVSLWQSARKPFPTGSNRLYKAYAWPFKVLQYPDIGLYDYVWNIRL